MGGEPFYKAHWIDIGPDRMAAYRDGFAWDDAAAHLYDPAGIAAGHRVVDFGCGPGKVAAVLAQLVGPDGHVEAIDINAAFLDLTRETAMAHGVADRVTTHLNDGSRLPLADRSVDRVTARNAIMYVDDPVATLSEAHRVLKPGGLAHAIDGDWYMMVAEPLDHDDWRAVVKAASHACRHADMGRKLHQAFAMAGFQDIKVKISATADLTGRLMGMIRNMASYAQQSDRIDRERADEVVSQMDRALSEGTYLVVSPQFVVTGRATG
ncbi:methyltransferase domain-containing protein [Jannaschia seohaensis]|uniref:Methyltransferase domain-containing protein n=1 Tax=Jannaschia seohaensis TaxID=475081 RepID=A0A2Y9AZQ4_9RHOB|nr:methyltransferase domain-containing protein [Jannaschia seohaensis]PWJ17491.1 methyltransferase family protein [Jannaschia seohaensis]SSA47589.1 Methyltransferase domain-containing protein [Jannaschia seohaensis]